MVRKEGQVVNVTGNDVGMERYTFMQLWWVKWHSHSTRRIKVVVVVWWEGEMCGRETNIIRV